jgi:hypothetical protein
MTTSRAPRDSTLALVAGVVSSIIISVVMFAAALPAASWTAGVVRVKDWSA